MKKIAILITLCSVLGISNWANAQTLGPYTLFDRFVSATHPNGCTDDYVVGWPTDSIWVNFSNGQVATGTFAMTWTDQPGDDLLLETGFHPANYNVRLMLQGGGFSAVHPVAMADWTYNMNVNWKYLFTSCGVGSTTGRQEYYLPLDFAADFGIGPADVVVGVEITFLTTAGAPDFAGTYIIQPVVLDENFLYFSAGVQNGSEVRLDWGTSPDFDYESFRIQRSADGEDWKDLKSLPVKPANGEEQEYRDWDPLPLEGTSYYRIKLIGQNGRYNYSEVQEVQLDKSGGISISPNPARNRTVVGNIDLPFDYSIFDALGRLVSGNRTATTSEIDLKDLKAGIYFIRIEDGQNSSSIRLVKE